jgi:hypothetical protein
LALIVLLYITFAILFSKLFYDHYLKKGGKKAAAMTNGTAQKKKKL